MGEGGSFFYYGTYIRRYYHNFENIWLSIFFPVQIEEEYQDDKDNTVKLILLKTVEEYGIKGQIVSPVSVIFIRLVTSLENETQTPFRSYF